MQPVSVIGGGFSGLMQAFYLVEAGFSVRVIEKSERLGGLLQSQRADGFLNESAANAMLANQELERVASVIQVPLFEANATSGKRYIYRDGQFRRWPVSVSASLGLTPFLVGRLFASGPPNVLKGETLWQWGVRSLGTEATEFLLEPAMQGVYACGLRQLDAELVLNSLFHKHKKGQLKGSVAPEEGLQEWIDGLHAYLVDHGCEFVFGNPKWGAGPRVFAVGLAGLKDMQANGWLDLPVSLGSTQLASLTSLKLSSRQESDLPVSFGCLFPARESFHSLGVLFNHGIFSGRIPAGGCSETWILNDNQEPVSQMDESEIIKRVEEDRAKISGSHRTWDGVQVDRWPDQIPIYNQRLSTFIRDLESFPTQDYFVGNYLGDLGLSKIIFRAQQNAKTMRSLSHG